MGKRGNHRLMEEYDGLLGFGFSREVDEYTLTYYLQKFSTDDLMGEMRKRLSDQEIEDLSEHLMRLMKKHLTDEEYHRLFLGDDEED